MDGEKFSDTLSAKHFFLNGGQIALKFSPTDANPFRHNLFILMGKFLHKTFIGFFCWTETAPLLSSLLQESENILHVCNSFKVIIASRYWSHYINGYTMPLSFWLDQDDYNFQEFVHCSIVVNYNRSFIRIYYVCCSINKNTL